MCPLIVLGITFLMPFPTEPQKGKNGGKCGSHAFGIYCFDSYVEWCFFGIGDALGLNMWVAQNTPYDQFSIEFILGYLFAPLMWIIGVATEDMTLMGQLLGIKIVAASL